MGVPAPIEQVSDVQKPLVSELKELSTRSTAIFFEILGVLDGVRTSATDMSAQINAVAEACRATTRGNDVSQMIDERIAELSDVLQQTHRNIDPKQVKTDLSNLMIQLKSILQNSGTFRYVSTLSKTTAATERMDNMLSNVELLKDIAEKLKVGSERATGQIETAVEAVEAVDVSLAAALKVVSDLCEQIKTETLEKPEAHNARRAYQDTVMLTKTLVAGNRRDLGALIGLMQFSDAFAQRLAHVWAILEDAETCSIGGIQIAKAQLSAMVTDAAEVRAAVTDALNRFAASCDTALNDLSVGLSGDTKAEILAQMDKLQFAQRLGGSVSDTMRQSEQQVIAASNSIIAVGEGLDEFHDLVALMRRSSYNVAIKASKHGDRQGPLAFLATIVANGSAETGRTILKMSDTLDGQKERLQEQVFADLKGAIEGFTASLEECEAIHTQVSAVDTHLETAGDAARRLTADIEAAMDILVRMTPIEDGLQHLLERLSTIELEQPQDDVCHWIYGIYTMDREREVHAAGFSVPEERGVQVGALDDDEFEEF